MSNRQPGMYDHLNEDDPPNISCTMPQLVTRVIGMNYGEHRFLSELLKQRKASKDYTEDREYREHTHLLQKLLESGYY